MCSAKPCRTAPRTRVIKMARCSAPLLFLFLFIHITPVSSAPSQACTIRHPSNMRCSHGDPWGHCFKGECVRRYKDNPRPNPIKGKWVAAPDQPTSTPSDQLRRDEEFARQLSMEFDTDQVTLPAKSKSGLVNSHSLTPSC